MYFTKIENHEQQPQQLTIAAALQNTALLEQEPIIKTTYNTVKFDELKPSLRAWIEHKVDRWHDYCTTALTEYKDTDMSTCYMHFEIPKPDGGKRPIDAPQPYLKGTLSTIKNTLSCMGIYPHNCAYAYVRGRGTADVWELHNARKNTHYLHLDMHNFFGSCTTEFIDNALTEIPFFRILKDKYPDDFANLIHIATLRGALPQGSPLSPWLTNQIMVAYDYQIMQICIRRGICYSRYADDMIFSAKSRFGNQFIGLIREVFQDTPLTLNDEKTHFSTVYGKNFHLGAMLNKDFNITIGHKKKEVFRATLVEFIKNGNTWTKQEVQQFQGVLQYYAKIEPEYFQNLLTKYNRKFNIDITSTLKERLR